MLVSLYGAIYMLSERARATARGVLGEVANGAIATPWRVLHPTQKLENKRTKLFVKG